MILTWAGEMAGPEGCIIAVRSKREVSATRCAKPSERERGGETKLKEKDTARAGTQAREGRNLIKERAHH